MKQSTEIYESALCAAATDECSQRVRAYIKAQKLPSREASRYALTVEEILLNAAETGGCDGLRLTTGKKLFRPRITLELFGKQFNAFHGNDAGSTFGNTILKNIGLSPEYYYSNNTNTYLLRIKKYTLSPVVRLIISLICAFTLGFAGKAFFPEPLMNGILNNVINPLHDTFMNLLSCIAGPMIFLSVAWGMYGIGDAATLKKTGKKLLKGYMGGTLLLAAGGSLLCILMFSPGFSDSSFSMSEISSIINMLLGIIPENIITPFSDGNTLQIIFLALVIGAAMLFLGKKTESVARAFEQINNIIQYLIEFISKLVPYFIFLVITGIIWSDSVSSLTSVGKYIAGFIVSAITMSLIYALLTAIRMKVNPLMLIKKGIPTFLIAVSTASSAAAFGTNMNACKNAYGINDTITSFGMPLGIVTFKPNTAINFVAASVFFASFYGKEISVSWILMMIFTVTVLSVATPPIPGGSMTSYTVLFAQLGIPPEAIALVLACDTLLDFVMTGCDQFVLPFSILPQADSLGMVDRAVLTAKNKAETGIDKISQTT